MKYIFLFLPFLATSQVYRIDQMNTQFLSVKVDGWVEYSEDEIAITVQGSKMVFKITERLYSADCQGHRVKMDKKVFRIMDYLDRITLEGETSPLIVNYFKSGT